MELSYQFGSRWLISGVPIIDAHADDLSDLRAFNLLQSAQLMGLRGTPGIRFDLLAAKSAQRAGESDDKREKRDFFHFAILTGRPTFYNNQGAAISKPPVIGERFGKRPSLIVTHSAAR